MAASTGPVLAAGAITWANLTLLDDGQPSSVVEESARIGLNTAIAAGVLYGVEQASPDLARLLAWTLVVTVLFVRVRPATPTPIERLFAFT